LFADAAAVEVVEVEITLLVAVDRGTVEEVEEEKDCLVGVLGEGGARSRGLLPESVNPGVLMGGEDDARIFLNGVFSSIVVEGTVSNEVQP